MRVVLSNSSYKWGGVHRITESLATGLGQRGHEVTVLTRPGSLLESRLGGRFQTLPVVGGGDLNPVGLLRVARALGAIRPDVVVTLMEKDVRLTGVAARFLRIPVVARRANDQPISRGAYTRLVYQSVVQHVANSQATRATMLASAPWLEPARVSVIYNGIDTEAIERAQPAALLMKGVLIGLIARLEWRKGVGDLLDAWPIVSAAAPDAHLLIVGRGAMDAEVRTRAVTQERVHVLGYREDVPALLKRLDIVAVPSHWEGFGLIAAEAMAAGKPVVAARASSLPEIVRDEKDGLLVPAHDPHALAAALIRLINDPEQRAQMGQRGRARVAETFGVERMVDEYEQLLDAVVRGRS